MIKENIQRIRAEIAQICARVGRQQEEIIIVAASKGRAAEQLKEVLEAGKTLVPKLIALIKGVLREIGKQS